MTFCIDLYLICSLVLVERFFGVLINDKYAFVKLIEQLVTFLAGDIQLNEQITCVLDEGVGDKRRDVEYEKSLDQNIKIQK